jgi:hypothetical protein
MAARRTAAVPGHEAFRSIGRPASPRANKEPAGSLLLILGQWLSTPQVTRQPSVTPPPGANFPRSEDGWLLNQGPCTLPVEDKNREAIHSMLPTMQHEQYRKNKDEADRADHTALSGRDPG